MMRIRHRETEPKGDEYGVGWSRSSGEKLNTWYSL